MNFYTELFTNHESGKLETVDWPVVLNQNKCEHGYVSEVSMYSSQLYIFITSMAPVLRQKGPACLSHLHHSIAALVVIPFQIAAPVYIVCAHT